MVLPFCLLSDFDPRSTISEMPDTGAFVQTGSLSYARIRESRSYTKSKMARSATGTPRLEPSPAANPLRPTAQRFRPGKLRLQPSAQSRFEICSGGGL